MLLNKEAKYLLGLYALTIVFYLTFVFVSGYSANDLGMYFQLPLFLLPFLGGIIGLKRSIEWGGNKSVVGQAIGLISLGNISWSFGMLLWIFYIFLLRVEIPYPSFADVFFLLAVPLWVLGVARLSKACGAHLALRKKGGKALLIILPLLAMLVSYYLLIQVGRGGEIDLSVNGVQLFFDLFYPFGDLIILTVVGLVYLLSRTFLGGVYKTPVIILFLGFILMYLSDFIFSYTTTQGTYFNGHIVDFLFASTMFMLSLAVSLIDSTLRKKI